jgi:hypothetical protein
MPATRETGPHLQGGAVAIGRSTSSTRSRPATELDTLRAKAAADVPNLAFQLGGGVDIIAATAKDSTSKERLADWIARLAQPSEQQSLRR